MGILVLTYWSYKDALVQTYTLPYVRIIRKNISADSKLFVLTLEQDFFKMSRSEWESEKEKLSQEGIILIRFKYNHFGLKMIFRIVGLLFSLVKLIRKEKIEFIHSWCMSAGSLGYILSLLTRKPLVIDSYEPHAEAMVENGTWSSNSLKFKLLNWLEKKQSNRAKTVIALTEGMKDYAKQKYNTSFKNYFVKPALVDLKKFDNNPEDYLKGRTARNLEKKIIGVYAGKLGGIYLEKEIFEFLKVASNHWKDRLKFFLLTDKNQAKINEYIKKNKIPKDCVESLFVDHHEIKNYLQIADFAINPVKPVPSKKYCTSIKDGEYWSMGLPVIITKNISDDSAIIQKENIGYVLENLNENEYLKACQKIDALILQNSDELKNKIISVASKYRSFEIAENIYREIYS